LHIQVDGRKLTEIINTDHVNCKYLPGVFLPTNVVACSNIVEACASADLLFFVVPHQFLGGLTEHFCHSISFPYRSQLASHVQKPIMSSSLNSFYSYQLQGVLRQLKGHVKSSAVGVSLIKGLDVGPNGPILLSQMIQTELGLKQEVAVVMGANVASEVAMVRVDQSYRISLDNECSLFLGRRVVVDSHRVFHSSVAAKRSCIYLCSMSCISSEEL
jgi:glycerol-3-phosphate dehydrogenase (NAD+)